MEQTNCIFCKITQGLLPAEFLYESRSVLAFQDVRPRAKFHILVIPKVHIIEFEAAESGELLSEMQIAVAALVQKYELRPNGYRVIINQGPDALQEVEHLHMHILGGNRLGPPF